MQQHICTISRYIASSVSWHECISIRHHGIEQVCIFQIPTSSNKSNIGQEYLEKTLLCQRIRSKPRKEKPPVVVKLILPFSMLCMCRRNYSVEYLTLMIPTEIVEQTEMLVEPDLTCANFKVPLHRNLGTRFFLRGVGCDIPDFKILSKKY